MPVILGTVGLSECYVRKHIRYVQPTEFLMRLFTSKSETEVERGDGCYSASD